MSAVDWLIDKSALWRAGVSAVSDVLVPRVAQGRVGVSIATELEVGFSARSPADYRLMRTSLVDHLPAVALPYRAETRAREVQAMLIEQGRHRSAGVADLLIAATAEMESLIVLHYDADFDLVAEVTGQPTEWIVPRGSI